MDLIEQEEISLKRIWGKLSFQNARIGKKYGIILGIVLSLFIISAIIIIFSLQNIADDIDAVERRGDRASSVGQMGSLLRSKSARIYQYVLNPTTEVETEFNERNEQIIALSKELDSKMDTTEERELFDQFVELDMKVSSSFNEIIGYMRQGETEAAYGSAIDAHEAQAEAIPLIDQLQQLVDKQQEEAIEKAKSDQLIAIITLVASIIVSAIISILLIFFVSRNITKNMNKVVETSNRITEGDLSVKAIDYNGKDEIGQLASSMNAMSEHLRKIITQVSSVSDTVSAQSEELNQSANEVKNGTEQIATTMQELASGSETQASQASDVATKMADFSNAISHANENGAKIEQASANVLSMTEDGRDMMGVSVEQMKRVNQIVKDAVAKVKGLDQQTKEISKLVSVIKDIAEQTNLLALNAAIESARAGEHGKGFAVVADEVRKLAEQVGSSVTDITSIVTNIQQESTVVTKALEEGYDEVEHGSAQIEQTGTTFVKINDAVHNMVSSLETINKNFEEISSSSIEINTSVEEIASISEESAAGVEQTSASAQQASSSMEEVSANSDELAKLAEELNSLVRQFKI